MNEVCTGISLNALSELKFALFSNLFQE